MMINGFYCLNLIFFSFFAKRFFKFSTVKMCFMIFYYFLLQKEGSRKRDKPCSDSFQSSPMKKMRSPSRRLSSPPPPPPPSTTTSSSSIRKPFLSSLNQQAGD